MRGNSLTSSPRQVSYNCFVTQQSIGGKCHQVEGGCEGGSSSRGMWGCLGTGNVERRGDYLSPTCHTTIRPVRSRVEGGCWGSGR